MALFLPRNNYFPIINVNSQSKFHSRKGVEFSMRNKRNLMWEKQDLTEKEVKNMTKN